MSLLMKPCAKTSKPACETVDWSTAMSVACGSSPVASVMAFDETNSATPCVKCGIAKAADEFYVRKETGRRRRACKDCFGEVCRQRRLRNIESVRLHDRERAKRKHGTPSRKATLRGWNERNIEKRRAHGSVWKALRSGRLVRPAACQSCGLVGRVQAHHHDYSKRLAVEWLCPTCHKSADAKRRRAA